MSAELPSPLGHVGRGAARASFFSGELSFSCVVSAVEPELLWFLRVFEKRMAQQIQPGAANVEVVNDGAPPVIVVAGQAVGGEQQLPQQGGGQQMPAPLNPGFALAAAAAVQHHQLEELVRTQARALVRMGDEFDALKARTNTLQEHQAELDRVAASSDASRVKRAADRLEAQDEMTKKIRRVAEMASGDPQVDGEAARLRFVGDQMFNMAVQAQLAVRMLEKLPESPESKAVAEGLRSGLSSLEAGSEVVKSSVDVMRFGVAEGVSRQATGSMLSRALSTDVPEYKNVGGLSTGVASEFTAYLKDVEDKRKKAANKSFYNTPRLYVSDNFKDIPLSPAKPFQSTFKCYSCQGVGHFARDCPYAGLSPAVQTGYAAAFQQPRPPRPQAPMQPYALMPPPYLPMPPPYLPFPPFPPQKQT